MELPDHLSREQWDALSKTRIGGELIKLEKDAGGPGKRADQGERRGGKSGYGGPDKGHRKGGYRGDKPAKPAGKGRWRDR